MVSLGLGTGRGVGLLGGSVKKKKKQTETALKQAETQAPAKVFTDSSGGGSSQEIDQNKPAEQPRILKDEKGVNTGIVLPDGRTFLGVTPKDIQKMISAHKEKREIPEGAIAQKEYLQQQRLGEAQIQQGEVLQRAGVFEEAPQEVNLAPPPSAGANLPIIGAGFGAVENLAKIDQVLSGGADLSAVFGDDPNFVRSEALDKIRLEALKEVNTASEKLGALIESIPVAGGLAAKYAGSLIKTPSRQVNTIISEINNEKERAINIGGFVSTGTMDSQTALESLNTIQEDLIALETRIQTLVLISPVLRSDPDQVSKIQSEILRAKERVYDARQKAAASSLQRLEPSNTDIYMLLRKLKEQQS